jgi:hypothetical protein
MKAMRTGHTTDSAERKPGAACRMLTVQLLRFFASIVQVAQRGRGSHFRSAHDLITVNRKLLFLSLLLPMDINKTLPDARLLF